MTLTGLALAVVGPWSPPLQAAPLAQTNLVSNGNMDTFVNNSVATGWEPWWEEKAKPSDGSLDYAYKPQWIIENNPTFVQSSSASQHIGNTWDPWHAGIRQTITAPPGSVVRITAYGRVFASTPDWPAASNAEVQSRMRIGAEPNGSIEWYAASVKWSGTANPHDTWAQFTLDVTTGTSGKVTIFLSTNYKGDSRYHLDAWWDNVSAVVVGQGSAATNTPAPGVTQQPTKPAVPPTAFVTPTPGADGSIVYVVQPGDTLFQISFQFGVSVDQIKTLNGLTSDLISIGQRLIIKTGAGPAATATTAVEQPTTAPTTDPNTQPTTDPNTTAPTATSQAAAASPTPLGTGQVCVLLWNDTNGNGLRDAESLLAGGSLNVVDVATGTPVATHITDGISEPFCFANLAAGKYTISAAAPANYNPTTANSIALEVKAGDVAALEFGAQPSGTNTGNTGNSSDNDRVLRTALFGAGGVLFLLLAIGVGVLLFMRRR